MRKIHNIVSYALVDYVIANRCSTTLSNKHDIEGLNVSSKYGVCK